MPRPITPTTAGIVSDSGDDPGSVHGRLRVSLAGALDTPMGLDGITRRDALDAAMAEEAGEGDYTPGAYIAIGGEPAWQITEVSRSAIGVRCAVCGKPEQWVSPRLLRQALANGARIAAHPGCPGKRDGASLSDALRARQRREDREEQQRVEERATRRAMAEAFAEQRREEALALLAYLTPEDIRDLCARAGIGPAAPSHQPRRALRRASRGK
ncbi:MAG TPA: hypothetical protein VH561_16855 [Micromonosporaceae bacterium]|jgi:hypothetical protein